MFASEYWSLSGTVRSMILYILINASYDLPLDVFGPDEKRASRTSKKKTVVQKRKQNGSVSEVSFRH